MTEPLKITDEMRRIKQKKIDIMIFHINNKIAEAVEREKIETQFDCYFEEVYDEVKRAFENSGYTFRENTWSRTGYSELICW